MTRTFVAVLLLVATTAWAGTSDPGIELIVTSVVNATPRTCYKTPGLPAWVSGTYIVSGPAKFELGEYKMNAIFDGFGMINRFELRGSEVCYTSAWMDTIYRNVSEEKGCVDGMLFEDTTPSRPMSCYTGGAGVAGDNNWVNAISVGGEVLMLSDTMLAMRLDLKTLAQGGRKAWTDDASGNSGNPSWKLRGHAVLTGSAHPVRRPGTNVWVGIMSEGGVPMMENSYVDFFTYDADLVGPQPRKRIGSSGPLKLPGYMHSFGVTPNYIVMPLTLGYGHDKGCIGVTAIMCSIVPQWQGIHVIDKKGVTTVFDTEPFMHVHIVNSFENATGVTLDVGAYQKPPFARSGQLDITLFLNKTTRDDNPTKATVRRLHMHTSGPLAGKTTFTDFEKTPNSHGDFFRMNDNFIGLPYCFYYATEWFHDGQSFANMAILKQNVCNGTRAYWTRPDVYVGEPYFIPGPSGEEDDGVLVFVALDGPQRRSVFVTLDAKTMKEVQDTTVNLDGHIPFTAHGDFFPDTSVIASTVV